MQNSATLDRWQSAHLADRTRLHRALTLALDPAAGEGEQQAAVRGFLRIARARGWKLPQLLAALGTTTIIGVERAPVPPWGWTVAITFGKYRGLTVGDIASRDPHYLRWCLSEMLRLDIDVRRAMECVLRWLDGQGGAQ
ncbi:MAG: hypothetical protein ABIP94_13495 [Planctomycetota bacterium]